MKKSAGIVLYRLANKVEILLVHPGGPFWKNKDFGAWSIPKGEFTDEEPLTAAIREFEEETGTKLSGAFIELRPVKLKSGKVVHAWALQGDMEAGAIRCDTFVNVEWPPRSGTIQSVPEVDKAAWFTFDEAKQKINPAQVKFIDELMEKLMQK